MQWLGTMPTTNQKMIFGVPLGQELPLTAAADCSLFAMVRVPRYVATEVHGKLLVWVFRALRGCKLAGHPMPRLCFHGLLALKSRRVPLDAHQVRVLFPELLSGSPAGKQRALETQRLSPANTPRPGGCWDQNEQWKCESNKVFQIRWEGFKGFAGCSKAY